MSEEWNFSKFNILSLSSLIWIQTVWHSDGIPKRFFWKKLILKNKSVEDKKNMQNYPACKELK